MKRLSLFVIVLLALSSIAHANQGDFCHGFSEGYKSVKGDLVLLPLCPLAPLTPVGSSDFREGLKAGIKAAKRRNY
jgi:hypothetical protein